MNKAKDIAIETIRNWIISSVTPEQLQVCWLATHDIIYIRYGDQNTANDLKLLIQQLMEVPINAR